jgi:outer membrane protein OmpA-like peptidoglycan-associated protein
VRIACSLWLFVATIAMGQERSFIACPIVRDTKTVPCFLAEYEGELYYLGIQQDITAAFHPPQLKHEVLVEGRVSEGPRVCGGIPLAPLSISVLKEVNLACNTLLPAEPGISAPPAARVAGPASYRLAEPPPTPESFTGSQEFTVLFAYNDDFVDFAAIAAVRRAAGYAAKIGASAVKVTGYRATTLLSNGERLVEKTELAENRAQDVATLLRGSGVTGVSADWKKEAEPGDGKTDAERRRVTITVIP